MIGLLLTVIAIGCAGLALSGHLLERRVTRIERARGCSCCDGAASAAGRAPRALLPPASVLRCEDRRRKRLRDELRASVLKRAA